MAIIGYLWTQNRYEMYHTSFRRAALLRMLLLCAVPMLFGAAACSDSGSEAPYLRVDPAALLFDPSSGEACVVNVASNTSWRVVPDDPAPATDLREGFGDGAIRIVDAPEGRSSFVVRAEGADDRRVTVTRFGGLPDDPDNPEDPEDPNDPEDPDNPEGPDTPDGPTDALFGKSWAELPSEVERAGDYYYACHMRADARSIRNYTVCYSREMMCPVWVAAPMHECYTGSSGRTDSYRQDPDLGCEQATKWDGYTRGHLLGSSDRTVSRETNRQVFYYSNIAPQLQNGFNTGGGVWNNLEEFTDRQWCADTLYQVVGCYWADRDTRVDGTVIPTHYYKVLLRTRSGRTGRPVAECTADELKCAAFVVEHRGSKGEQPNASMMISVSELERMTGFTFFPNVPNAPKDRCNPSDWGL